MSVIFPYFFIIISIILFMYIAILYFEQIYGNRFLSNFRLYIDNKIVIFIKFISKFFKKLKKEYEISEDKFEEEIFQPFASPFIKTKKQFIEIQTGVHEFEEIDENKVSEYLKDLQKIK